MNNMDAGRLVSRLLQDMQEKAFVPDEYRGEPKKRERNQVLPAVSCS